MKQVCIGRGPLGYTVGEQAPQDGDVQGHEREEPSMTPEQVKANFIARGESIGQWADKHGFPRPMVYDLLNRRVLGLRGRRHAAAVALGIKPNVNQPVSQ